MIVPAQAVSGRGRAGGAVAAAQSARGTPLTWRRMQAAGDRLAAQWLQLDAVPCRTPGKPWLPGCARRRGDRNELAILGDRQGLSGGERAAGEHAAIPDAIAAYGLGCSTRAGGQYGASIGIGRDEAGAMVSLKRTETTAPKPTRLVFPDGIGSERRRGTGQCGDLGIDGSELGVAANQSVGCILRARAVGLELSERGWDWRWLSGRWIGAGNEQRQQP
jgi:hypothetical protein